MPNETGLDVTTPVPPATAYAIRAWYTSVLGQTRQARQDLSAHAERMLAEVERVEAQVESCDRSIAALESVLDTVDDWIRRLTAGDDDADDRGAKSSTAGRRPARSRRAQEGEDAEIAG